MLISIPTYGLIYAGNTQLQSSLIVSETGPLELTISAGSFTTTGDTTRGIPSMSYTLLEDSVCPITNNTDTIKQYTGELVTSQWGTEIFWVSWFMQQPFPPYPEGYVKVHTIVYSFNVPPNVQTITDVEIMCLTVLPGFPPETSAADWYEPSAQLITGVT